MSRTAQISDFYLVLTDDFSLAAVDMHTAQHIVDHCLRGKLAQDRTMILVTHHISMCLSSASYIVELGAGKVILRGDVKELQASGKVKTVIDTQDETANADDDEVEVTPINEADADTSKSEVSKRTRSFNGKLIEAEHREEGRVSIATYLNYSKSIRASQYFLTSAFCQFAVLGPFLGF